MRFVAIYMAPSKALDKMMRETTPEERAKGMQLWQEWIDAHRSSFVDEGAPLGRSKRVTNEGITDTRNDICGYSVVEADSHDDAAELFADSPHLEAIDGAYIDVLAWVEMDGMDGMAADDDEDADEEDMDELGSVDELYDE